MTETTEPENASSETAPAAPVAKPEPLCPEPIVFLPGFLSDARIYWHQVIALSAHRPVQVSPLGPSSSIVEMANFVLSRAPERFALAGHWLGALVAAEIVRIAPERVSRLVLMSINHLSESPEAAAAREARLVAVKTGRLVEALLEEVPEGALAPGEGLRDVQALMLDMADALGTQTYIAHARALMRRPDPQRVLRATRVPTLILCGQHDKLCPVRRHQLLAEMMQDASIIEIAGAGHMLTLEQPEAVSRVMKDWLG